jgi:hypothetical protein
MGAPGHKQYIQDPLYGMVHLSELEMRIIDSRAFQRLLNVKQLGYAYAVFPGADYSRFAHCVGACAVMGRWLETLERNGTPLPGAQTELYRLAALMHDIGHYPFSHATERAVKKHYQALMTASGADQDEAEPEAVRPFFEHEELGAYLVQHDPELNGIITEFGLSYVALQRVFERHELAHYANLLSADVDADRLDFLRRTAVHTGMPYGQIDQQYLITELRLDSDRRLCWTDKALSALDQILIARYFDYQQVVFNKTVVALELVLERLVGAMLKTGDLDLSRNFVEAQLKADTWIQVDDHHLFHCIRDFEKAPTRNDAEREMCRSILCRNPPRRVFDLTFTDWYDLEPQFDKFVNAMELCIPEWSRTYQIDQQLWFIWSNKFRFTEYKWGIEVDDHEGADELAKVPRVLKGSNSSIPIIKDPKSLMNSLYAKRRYAARLYVILPEMADPQKRPRMEQLRRSIESGVGKQLIELDQRLIGSRFISRFPEHTTHDPTLF